MFQMMIRWSQVLRIYGRDGLLCCDGRWSKYHTRTTQLFVNILQIMHPSTVQDLHYNLCYSDAREGDLRIGYVHCLFPVLSPSN